ASSTPAAVAAPAPTATAVTATPAATAAVLPGLGLVNHEAAAAGLLAGQGLDGGLGLLVGAHLDEAAAPRPARLAVPDDLGRLHRAVGLEHPLQLAAVHVEGQVAHVQLLAHLGLRGKGAGRPPGPCLDRTASGRRVNAGRVEDTRSTRRWRTGSSRR